MSYKPGSPQYYCITPCFIQSHMGRNLSFCKRSGPAVNWSNSLCVHLRPVHAYQIGSCSEDTQRSLSSSWSCGLVPSEIIDLSWKYLQGKKFYSFLWELIQMSDMDPKPWALCLMLQGKENLPSSTGDLGCLRKGFLNLSWCPSESTPNPCFLLSVLTIDECLNLKTVSCIYGKKIFSFQNGGTWWESDLLQAEPCSWSKLGEGDGGGGRGVTSADYREVLRKSLDWKWGEIGFDIGLPCWLLLWPWADS